MVRTVIALTGLFVAIVLGAAAPAFADTDGSLTFGSQWWTQTAPEAKFQEFREVPRGAFLENYALRSFKGRNLLEFYGANALRSDQTNTLAWWNGARLRLDLDYTQIPHNISFVTRSPYTQVGLGTLLLPDSLQRANQQTPASYASRMKDLLDNSPRVNMGFRTDISRGRLRGRPAQGFQVELTGVRRERSGRKPYGGSFGFNSDVELYEPISQRSVDADARASYERAYASAALKVEARAGLSAFDNNVDALVWDNPKRLDDRVGSTSAGDGTSQGRIDLYPDNRSIHGELNLGLTLPHRTAATALVGVRQNTQDDPWLPYTINTAILQPDSFPLPGTNTHGKATILTQDYRLSSRPVSSVGGTVRYRQYYYDNRTPEHVFAGRVTVDQAWTYGPFVAEPRGYRHQDYGVDLDWRPISRATLNGTYEVLKRDRTHREVESDEEKAWSVGAQLRIRPDLSARGKFRHGERTIDSLLIGDYQSAPGTFSEQPGLRRFDVANRNQDLANASVSWVPNEKMSLATMFTYEFNDYQDSPLGLRSELSQTVGVEGSYHPVDRFDFSGGYGWGQVQTDQHSRESGATLALTDSTAWRARLKDWNSYAYGTIEYWIRPDKVSLTTSYEFERSPGIYQLTNAAGTAQSLPGTRYRRQDAVVELGYKLDEGTRFVGRWSWEQWDVTDFATENVPLFFPLVGANNAIFLGDSSLDYNARAVAILVQRTF